MNSDKITAARQQIVEMGHVMIEKHLVAGSWGNISCRLEGDKFTITPSGRGYAALQPADVVVVDGQCNVIDGSLIPSSESPLHAAIYAACPEAGAIIHTHSIYASALAAMHKSVPAYIEDIVQIIGGRVECAAYALPGTEDLARNAVAAMQGRKAVLLANHGAVAWGKNLADALIVAEVLEKAAQIAIICQQCGGAVELPDEDIQIMHRFYTQHYQKRQQGEE